MAKKTLYVHPEESIAYLINRIENTEADEILISADGNPELFTDLVNLKLLKREIDVMGKKVLIASQDQGVLSIVGNAGFDVASESDDAQPAKRAAKTSKKTAEQAPQPVQVSEVSSDDGKSEIVLPWMKKENVQASDAGEIVPVTVRQEQMQSHEPNIYQGSAEKQAESSFLDELAKSRAGRSPEPENIISENQTEEHPSEYLGRIENIKAARSSYGAPIKNPYVKKNWALHAVILAAVGGLLVFGGFILLTPKLSLKVMPKKEVLNFEFKATADINLSSADLSKEKIPGQIIKVEKELSDEFTATGKQEQESKAEGAITIYNEFGPVAQRLVQNTRFRTKDGKIFHLKSAVVVPGAKMEGDKVIAPGVVNASVIADQQGVDYNVGPSDFVIPGFEGTPKFIGFYGKSSDYMKGGASGNSWFASEKDLADAKESLNTKLNQAADEYARANIPQGMRVIDNARLDSVSEFSAEPINQENGKFKAAMKITFSVFVFAESDIAALIEHNLISKVADIYSELPGTRTISYADSKLGAGKTTLEFNVKVNETLVGKINTEEIASQLAGKDESQIREILSVNEAIESVELTFRPFPFWSSSAPTDPKNIKVTIAE